MPTTAAVKVNLADNTLAGNTAAILAALATAGLATEDGLAAALSGKETAQTAASQAEAEAGTETAIRKYSPLRIKQAIAALASTGPANGRVETENVTLTPGTSNGSTMTLDRSGDITANCAFLFGTSGERQFAFSNDPSDLMAGPPAIINVPWPSTATAATLAVTGLAFTAEASQTCRFTGTIPGSGNTGDITLVQGADFADGSVINQAILRVSVAGLGGGGPLTASVDQGWATSSGMTFYVDSSGMTDDEVANAIAAQLTGNAHFSASSSGSYVELSGIGATLDNIGQGFSGSFTTGGGGGIGTVEILTPVAVVFDSEQTMLNMIAAFNADGSLGVMTDTGADSISITGPAFGPDAVLGAPGIAGTADATPGSCAAAQDADCVAALAAAMNIVISGLGATALGTVLTLANPSTDISGYNSVWDVASSGFTGQLLTHSVGSGRLVSLDIACSAAEPDLALVIGGTARAFALPAAGIYALGGPGGIIDLTGGILGNIRTPTDATIVITASALNADVEVSACVRKS